MVGPSPYNATAWQSHGMINSSHITNLTMFYQDGTLPTPWPWVVCSLSLSVVLGSVSVYTSVTKLRKARPARLSSDTTHWYPPSRYLAALAATGVMINSIRSVATFGLAIRAAAGKSHTPAAPSAILVLMATLHISITNLSLQPIFTYIAKTACLFAWIASIVNVYGTISSSFYSDGVVVGGNCAFPYHDCVAHVTGTEQPSYLVLPASDYGCPDFSPSRLGRPDTPPIRIAEGSFGGISGLYGFIIFLYHPDIFRFLILPFDLLGLLKRRVLVAKLSEWWTVPVDADLDKIAKQSWMARVYPKRSPRTLLVIAQGLALLIVIVVCAVSVPMHVKTEKYPKGTVYIDGSPSSEGLGPPAWTDCFRVKPPTNRLGFWDVWWEKKSGWVIRAIAVT